MRAQWMARIAATAALVALGGCELFENDGTLDLQLTDAPYTDALHVYVTVERVRLEAHDGDHESFDLDPAPQIDLLALSNGATATLLDGEHLKSGDYESIRLELGDDASVVRKDGGEFPLEIGDDRLELDTDFTIDDHGTTRLVLDVDLRRSLREDGDEYRLQPQLRLVDEDDSGAVAGSVRGSLIDSGCVPAVYVYAGETTPDDIGGNGAQPLTSSNVVADGSGDFRYTAAFLPEGRYTLALTCEADEDDPDESESLDFVATEHADVDAGRTETQDF